MKYDDKAVYCPKCNSEDIEIMKPPPKPKRIAMDQVKSTMQSDISRVAENVTLAFKKPRLKCCGCGFEVTTK